MKNFKLVSEAEDSYHIEHKNGKKFTVDKKGLNKRAHEEIRKLCGGGAVQKFKNGGNVKGTVASRFSDIPQETPAANNNQFIDMGGPAHKIKPTPQINPDSLRSPPGLASAEQYDDYGNKIPSVTPAIAPIAQPMTYEAIQPEKGFAYGGQVKKYAGGGEVEDDGAGAGEGGESAVAAPAAEQGVAQDPTQVKSDGPIQNMQKYGEGYGKILSAKEKALSDYQQQAGAANKQIQSDYTNTLNRMSPNLEVVDAVRSPEEIQAEMAKKNDDWMDAIQKKGEAFDPNRYWNNKDTGHKVLSAIALAIGGAGAGRGGRNLAAEHIDKAVANDIEDQKNDYSNTVNLYKMNHSALQDELSASLTTKNQLLSVAQMQLAKQMAAISGAKSNLETQNAMQDLELQKAQNNRAIALLSQRPQGPGGKLAQDPTTIAAQLIRDPAHQKAALDEIQHNEGVEKSRTLAMQNFNNLADKHLGGKLSPADRKSAINATVLDISSRLKMRPSQVEPLIEENFPGAGLTGLESEETIANKRQRLNQLFDNQKNDMPHMKMWTGLGPDSFNSTSSSPLTKLNNQEMRMYNIAKSHPNHPDSIKFMKKYRLSQ